MVRDRDEIFMREALRQARKGLGRTSPNPAVGAVIVRRGNVVSTGYHRKAGAPHAEIDALTALGGRCRKQDTLYVNLEPCNHQGRTPPCTESLLACGIGRVVVGMKDPNPGVKGGGCEFLAARGVRVTTGILEAECQRLNEAWVKFVSTGRPFVIAKSAMTLDGWTATSAGHSRWVTNERSRRFVHRLRDRVDAVMVGIGTVLADDPHLTVRLPGGRGRDPLRIVVDTHLRIPPRARVLGGELAAGTLLALGEGVSPDRVKRMKEKGISTLVCPEKEGRVDLGALMDALGRMSVTSLLLEGGASLMASMIRERLIDKFYLFKAPKILGGGDGIPMASGPGPGTMDEALVLRDIRVRRFGEDILIRGYPHVHGIDRGAG